MIRSIQSIPQGAALLTLGLTCWAGSANAQNLPSGERTVSGFAYVGRKEANEWGYNQMAIEQRSPTAIMNWERFSIGEKYSVVIRQPNAQARILNRVTGSTPSTIAGKLSANGQVFIVNPNGIAITATGQVSAGGGFVASTLGIRDEDFDAGRFRFFGGNLDSTAIVNEGSIGVGSGGYASLISGTVENRGTIVVPLGRVGLGSGTTATLDFSGNGFLQVAISPYAAGGKAEILNSGTISANGGSVTLTAVAARDKGRQVVNLSGTIEARSVNGTNGNIILSAGHGERGEILLSPGARIDAFGTGGENGGRVAIAAGRVSIDGAVDVSGAKGGLALVTSREKLSFGGKIRATGQDGKIGLLGGYGKIVIEAGAKFEMTGENKPYIKSDGIYIAN